MPGRVRRIRTLLAAATALALCAGGAAARPGWQVFRKAQDAVVGGAAWLGSASLPVLLYNPSLLAPRNSPGLSFVSLTGTDDERLGGILYGVPLGDCFLAGGLLYYDAGPVELNWIDGGRLLTEVVPLQRDCVGLLSCSRCCGGTVSLGGNLKAATSTIAGARTAVAAVFDGGVTVRVRPELSASLCIRNAGIATRFIERAEELPRTVSFHVSGRRAAGGIEICPVAAGDWEFDDAVFVPSAGIEVRYAAVSFDVAVQRRPEGTPLLLGGGLRAGRLEVSYAWALHPWLGASHRFGISYRFAPRYDIPRRLNGFYLALR